MEQDDMELPDVEVIYLDDGEELEIMGGYDGEEFDASEGEDAELDDNRFIEEIKDISKLTFKLHKKSVFVCALSTDESIAITGGEDDVAYLWTVANGEVILECTGHKDSVTEVAFNHDNTLVATGDMGGLIQVWSVKDKKLIWCIEGDDTEWIQWHHLSNILLVGTSSGDVYIYLVPSGNCKVLPSSGFAANCGKLLSDGKHILVGYANGTLKLWDIKTSTAKWQYTDSSETSINSMQINADNTLITVCPSAQIIKVADGKVLTALLSDGETEIESCDFSAELGVVATGALSGQICVWELGKYALRHEAKIECAVTKMKFGKDGKLFIAGTDGAIYVCNARTGLLAETLTGHESEVLDFAVGSSGTIVLSTSDDGTARIFDVKPE